MASSTQKTPMDGNGDESDRQGGKHCEAPGRGKRASGREKGVCRVDMEGLLRCHSE